MDEIDKKAKEILDASDEIWAARKRRSRRTILLRFSAIF